MLNCERNTKTMGIRVEAAARKYFHKKRVSSVFEHGQWWVELADGSQYSVNDADGGDSVNGFCFEQVSNGWEG